MKTDFFDMRAAAFALIAAISVSCIPAANADSITGQGTFEQTDIPDGEQVASTINILDSGFIEDISVTISGLNHTNAGDLIAELRLLEGGQTNGGNPAYLFFRANVDGQPILGSPGTLGGNYTFTTNQNDRNFWSETATQDPEPVDDTDPFFASDENGDFLNLAGPDFFQDVNAQGLWQLVITDANSIGNNVGSVAGWSIDFEVRPIPEPGSAAVIALVAVCLTGRRRR